jgi:hypothetical protein
VLDWGVILFDYVNQYQPVGRVICYRESHGVRGSAAREAVAAPTGVAEVATFIETALGETRR